MPRNKIKRKQCLHGNGDNVTKGLQSAGKYVQNAVENAYDTTRNATQNLVNNVMNDDENNK